MTTVAEYLQNNKHYLMVGEFQEFYNFKSYDTIELNVLFQRLPVLTEEYKELIKSTDIINKYDALCDIKYVIYGTLYMFKTHDMYHPLVQFLLTLNDHIDTLVDPELMNRCFIEVHRSNMSKSCISLDEVHATMSQPKYKNIKFRWDKKGKKYLIFIDANYPELDLMKNKLVKSINYSKADLSFLLENSCI